MTDTPTTSEALVLPTSPVPLPSLAPAISPAEHPIRPASPTPQPTQEPTTSLFAPGWLALGIHHIAHALFQQNLPLIPRLLSALARFLTGTDIHPGAQIGAGVTIHHGSGVVIGETAIVGDGTIIHQEVTLGGTGKDTGKRHPTLGKNVIVGAGAKILGNITIGDAVRVGAGAIVLRHAPSHTTVVGIPGRNLTAANPETPEAVEDWQPDLEAQVIQQLFTRLKAIETHVQALKASPDHPSPDVSHSNQLIEEFLDGAGI